MASGAVTGVELMERAGAGVVAAIMAQWPGMAAEGAGGAEAGIPAYLARGASHKRRRASVLCGPGNNGGDGYVVARLLAERGWQVKVFAYGDPARLPPDARHNYVRWCGIGPVARLDDPHAPTLGTSAEDRVDVVVDALFGMGMTRAVPMEVQDLGVDLVNWMHRYRVTVPVVAVDMPSGLCADSGHDWGCELRADLTVTFHAKKLGHVLGRGPELCGTVQVVDIGLPQRSHYQTAPAEVVQETGPARWLLGKWEGHKYSYGHAVVLSGPPGAGGAARLAARGALRVGAGLVTVACPEAALPENAAQLTAIMLRRVADGPALAEVLEDPRITALCLGPGLGTGTREAALLEAALEPRRSTPAPRLRLVLDADALTILAQEPDLFGALHVGCVLTPHAGEFARLFPDLAERLAASGRKGPVYSKVEATRDAAARAGCVVLFKGPDTVIAAPDGRCAINAAAYARAAPWLATAGSGDVLAGFVAGLLARGRTPFEAACTGAWLHVECARAFGPGLIAEDLPDALPQVLRGLGL